MIRSPGPGWVRLSGSVYEHSSRIRIHTLGTIRFSDGSFRSENDSAWRAIRRQGGNRKRGLMVWALENLSDIS